MKLDVATNDLVESGSVFAVSKSGRSFGMTNIITMRIAASKNTMIIAGYVTAPLSFCRSTSLFRRSSARLANDLCMVPDCSQASTIETSETSNVRGSFFIAKLITSPESIRRRSCITSRYKWVYCFFCKRLQCFYKSNPSIEQVGKMLVEYCFFFESDRIPEIWNFGNFSLHNGKFRWRGCKIRLFNSVHPE